MKTLKIHLKDRETAIISILKQARESYTAETFHKFRVEIKKLNALLDIIAFSFKKFRRKKTFRPFKRIFRQAGKVRECQLEEKILLEIALDNPLTEYLQNLKQIEQEETAAYFAIIDEEFLDRLRKKFRKLSFYLCAVRRKKALKYLERLQRKINKELNQKCIPPHQVHDIRKQLKLLIYNTDSLSLEKDMETVALSDLTGQWHDYQVLIHQLENTEAYKQIDRKEKTELALIKRTLECENQLLYRKINLALPNHSVENISVNLNLSNTQKVSEHP